MGHLGEVTKFAIRFTIDQCVDYKVKRLTSRRLINSKLFLSGRKKKQLWFYCHVAIDFFVSNFAILFKHFFPLNVNNSFSFLPLTHPASLLIKQLNKSSYSLHICISQVYLGADFTLTNSSMPYTLFQPLFFWFLFFFT